MLRAVLSELFGAGAISCDAPSTRGRMNMCCGPDLTRAGQGLREGLSSPTPPEQRCRWRKNDGGVVGTEDTTVRVASQNILGTGSPRQWTPFPLDN